MKHCRTLVLSLLFGTCSLGSMGPVHRNALGTLTDPSGAVVPHAHVVVHSLATGADRVIDTDDAWPVCGAFAAAGRLFGQGDRSTDSATTACQKVTLEVDQKVSLNMHLALSSAGETVQVESTARADRSHDHDRRPGDRSQHGAGASAQRPPLPRSHRAHPGGVVAPTSGSLTGASRGLGANSFITAGNREDSVNFQINGVNLNDMSQNQITFQPSINTTSEFKINNSTFSAEYGRSSGSIVNVSTRSGTNQFHGEVFDYFRNEALDARNYFNRSTSPTTGLPLAGVLGDKAPLKRNNFGASVGGPIWKNHTFFFASYEGLRQHQGILQNSPVLSAGAACGDRRCRHAGGERDARGHPDRPTAAITTSPSRRGRSRSTSTPATFSTSSTPPTSCMASTPSRRTCAPSPRCRAIPSRDSAIIATAHRQVLTINETHIFSPSLVNEGASGLQSHRHRLHAEHAG